MTEGLLKTKLFAPPPHRNLVARPRLLNKLAETFFPEIRLTLVCAPAGFGKTTMVTGWLSKSVGPNLSPEGNGERKSAWLTLDEADNTPIRFWRYVDGALHTIDPRLGESIRPLLYAPQPPPFRSLMEALVNDIFSVGVEFLLVLDDYHVIQNDSIHESVNFLIDHLPPLAHLIITTRSDPPLQLARRRARGELCELRAADLRFTHQETALFINEVMRLGLSPEDVAALEARTEGWIAGLQMAAISLQDVSDPHAFVAAFRGDDRYIADYLLEEVLQRQPVEFQRFLLQTSVLDRLCGSLCDALTGRSDSQAVLNSLERSNLFIIPLDNHREWFRYHHMFASLLQQRLFETDGPAAVVDLKRKASQWHAAHGYVVDSIEIAISCGESEQAVSVIEVSDATLFMGPELNSLSQWSERIPAPVIAAHPRLNVMAAWANHVTGHVQHAERFVQLLEQAAGVSVDDFLENPAGCPGLNPVQHSALLEGAVIRARIAVDSLQLEKTFRLGERTLPHLVNAPDASFAFNSPETLRCVMLFILALAHEFHGDPARAAGLFAEAEAEAWGMRNPHIIALAAGHLGKMYMLLGQPQQAAVTFQQLAQAANDFPPRSSAFWGLAQIGLGELALAQGDLDAAEAHFQQGLEQGKMWNNWECLLPGMIGHARVRAAQGDEAGAYVILDDLLNRVASSTIMVRPAVETARAEIRLQQGDLPAAARWAATFDALVPGAHYLQWEQSALTAAQIWLAEGKRAEAETLLSRLLAEAQSAGRQQTSQRILQIRGSFSPAGQRQPIPAVPFDNLSERELEVLRFMADGLSNPDIARKLTLSPNTLKAHTQNIYSKLNVHNRIEAINKARELNLF